MRCVHFGGQFRGCPRNRRRIADDQNKPAQEIGPIVVTRPRPKPAHAVNPAIKRRTARRTAARKPVASAVTRAFVPSGDAPAETPLNTAAVTDVGPRLGITARQTPRRSTSSASRRCGRGHPHDHRRGQGGHRRDRRRCARRTRDLLDARLYWRPAHHPLQRHSDPAVDHDRPSHGCRGLAKSRDHQGTRLAGRGPWRHRRDTMACR